MRNLDPETTTVGEIVAENDATAGVFLSHDIDFCCGGDRTLAEAADEAGVAVDEVVADLRTRTDRVDPGHRYTQWSPAFLARYIENEHHAFTREVIPEITELADKVAQVHGDKYPSLQEIADVWADLAPELRAHLDEEEAELFPRLEALEDGSEDLTADEAADLLAGLRDDHEGTGAALEAFEDLTDGFQTPRHACRSWAALYDALETFVDETRQHVHLENNVLFPKVREQLDEPVEAAGT